MGDLISRQAAIEAVAHGGGRNMSMDDLISRQAAIDAIVNTVSGIGLHDNSEVARYGATFRQHEIIDIIEGMPSAQPEIVRCKDCKWFALIDNISVPLHICKKCDTFRYGYEFCSRGERREERINFSDD